MKNTNKVKVCQGSLVMMRLGWVCLIWRRGVLGHDWGCGRMGTLRVLVSMCMRCRRVWAWGSIFMVIMWWIVWRWGARRSVWAMRMIVLIRARFWAVASVARSVLFEKCKFVNWDVFCNYLWLWIDYVIVNGVFIMLFLCLFVIII